MALIKNVESDIGVDATYWHIFAINSNRVQSGMDVVLAGYVSAEARTDGKSPALIRNVSLNGDAFPGTADGITYAAIYAAVKALDAWSDAVDA